jgi:hypothetical protein
MAAGGTHASSGPDFAQAARQGTLALHEQLTGWLSQ